MGERWKGLVQASCTGTASQTRVMASLCLSAARDALVVTAFFLIVLPLSLLCFLSYTRCSQGSQAHHFVWVWVCVCVCEREKAMMACNSETQLNKGRVGLFGVGVRRQPPESNVVFFVGDRVEGTYNQEIERLSKLETIAAILVSKLGPSVNAWVVEPSHYKGSFACYDNFVPSLTTSGEPSGASYNPSGLPSSRACLSLLTNCLSQVCLSACLSPVLF